MNETLIPLTEAIQLLALGPCLFIVAFLLLATRNLRQAAIPALYFLSLSASFMLPLRHLTSFGGSLPVHALLLFGESLTPAFCFLLVLQLTERRPPFGAAWLILALPLLGGTSFVYGTLMLEEVCVQRIGCFATVPLMSLYQIFMAAVIFLLLMAHLSQLRKKTAGESAALTPASRHAYWLVVSLIALSLAIPILDLGRLANVIPDDSAMIVSTLVRIAFIYLVLTSLFRLYGEGIELDAERVPTLYVGRLPPNEDKLAERLLKLMREEGLYRQTGLTRDIIAEKAGLSEQAASRIINQRFGKNVTEFVNEFRIEEAKSRLLASRSPVNAVAYAVGFNSIASFNRVFRAATGMSPTAYREAAGSSPEVADALEGDSP